ncbi:hypothetical protein ABPG72_009623 [Tetrahymena utriculariae]
MKINRVNIIIYYTICFLSFLSFGDDRFVSYIDGSQNMGLNTFNCPDAAAVQFQKKYYGIFDQNTLSSSPGLNVGYFKFDTPIPHYEREVNIDLVYLRGDGQNQITIQLDGATKSQFGIDQNSFQVEKLCDKKYNIFNMLAYYGFEQYLKYRLKYKMYGQNIVIRVSECDNLLFLKALLTSSIQVNVNTCHPSCLSCTDSTQNSCMTCSPQANLQNGKCICKNQAQFFQDGQCVSVCDNTQQYYQKQSGDQICTYIQNCLSWDVTNQKCLQCQNLMITQLDKCVSSCSSGFQPVLNTKTKLQECLFNDRFLNDDRFVSYIDGSQNMGLNTFNCPDAAAVQFKKKYYGIFDQNTLNSPPGMNVGYFQFNTPIPHYEREVNIDFVYLRGNGQNQITIQLDGAIRTQFGIDQNSFNVEKLCDKKYYSLIPPYREFEQYLKYPYDIDEQFLLNDDIQSTYEPSKETEQIISNINKQSTSLQEDQNVESQENHQIKEEFKQNQPITFSLNLKRQFNEIEETNENPIENELNEQLNKLQFVEKVNEEIINDNQMEEEVIQPNKENNMIEQNKYKKSFQILINEFNNPPQQNNNKMQLTLDKFIKNN